jgi:hypothetical protein
MEREPSVLGRQGRVRGLLGREHARRCAEIPLHAASPKVRDRFTSLEQTWLRLAIEIESGQKLLDVIDEISRDLVPHVEAAE